MAKAAATAVVLCCTGFCAAAVRRHARGKVSWLGFEDRFTIAQLFFAASAASRADLAGRDRKVTSSRRGSGLPWP